MSGPSRLPTGGLVDRGRALGFTFDGRAYAGHPGDTLASALLANGVTLMGRSFKYHRPRGVLAAGVEEPNALVEAGVGGRFEPNTRATDLFLYDGLSTRSQNRWPSLALDLGAVNQAAARFIPAAFYYKTFFGGPKAWLFYERFIRKAAGLGGAPVAGEVDAFEHRAAFCDVLVVGAGAAGLAAALAASEAGARVMLVEQDAVPGGALLRDPAEVEGQPGDAWAHAAIDTLRTRGARVLLRATAFGVHDQGLVTVAERCVEPGQAPAEDGLAQRVWKVRARRLVLAQGAIERPLLFSGNDRPGVMLASAARTYAARFGVRPGSRAVVAGCGEDAYLTALALADAGVELAAVVDSRPSADGPLADAARGRFPVHLDAQVVKAKGRLAVSGATVAGGGRTLELACDLIASAGGWTPSVHLHMHAGGTLDWDEAAGAFVPASARQGQVSVGAGSGRGGLSAALADGWSAGAQVASGLGFAPPTRPLPRGDSARPAPERSGAHYGLHPAAKSKTAFVDYQNDVTAADVELAHAEGFRPVEHLKRYTTLGMASDQGKTSNLTGLARMAAALGKTPPEVGLTTFRPPFTPVTLGALAGEAVGAHAAPRRRLPAHAAHEALAATWQPSGYWDRPRAYLRAGETLSAAALREARAVREAIGVVDVSTLAKFEVAGPDAAAFLERVCVNGIAKLAVGRGRYVVMLREDGIVADDGTVWRVAEHRYLLTSSTGGADRMAHHLSYVRKVLAPELQVTAVAVQERWAGFAVAGPLARAVVAGLADAGPPRHMSVARARIAGVEGLLLGASYSGERAFEVYVPSFDAPAVWCALQEEAAHAGGGAYGLDAMDLLRIEKGHLVVGAEIDGRMSPHDLSLSKMLRPAGGFVGWAGLQRPAFVDPDRLRLVGLEAMDGALPEGAMVLPREGAPPEGHVTSAGRRVLGEGAIGLGLVRRGPDRLGETLLISSPTRGLSGRARVVEPLFYDGEGVRYRD